MKTELVWTICIIGDPQHRLENRSDEAHLRPVAPRTRGGLTNSVVQKIREELRINDGLKTSAEQMKIITHLKLRIIHQRIHCPQITCHLCSKDPLLCILQYMSYRLLHHLLHPKTIQLMIENGRGSELTTHLRPHLQLENLSARLGRWKLMKTTMMMGRKTRKEELFRLLDPDRVLLQGRQRQPRQPASTATL
jgi:hypothetical protein